MSYTNYNNTYRRNKIREPAQLLAASNIFNPTASQTYMLGCIFEMNDGRAFRYSKAVSDITRARMACGLPPDANTEEIPQAGMVAVKGNTRFNVLLTGTNGVVDGSLIDGYMFINGVATVLGDFYIIKNNKWITGDTVLELEISDAGGLRTDIGTSDELCVIHNRFYNVKVNPNTQDAAVIGVPLVDIDASDKPYFWAQYRGICPLLIDSSDAVAIGAPVGYPSGTPAVAGTGGVIANDGSDQTWGVVVSAGAADEISLVDLLIP